MIYALNKFSFFPKLGAAIRRAGSPPPAPIVIPPESRLFVQIPGGHVLVGVLEPITVVDNLLPPPVLIRMPYGQDLIANALHIFANEDNPNINEFRCYIPLPNGKVCMAFLEPDLYALSHSSSTSIYVRIGNNTHLSGFLRRGEGYCPSWLPHLGRSG